jgi:hypothetical protein
MCDFHENQRREDVTYKRKLSFAHIFCPFRPIWVIFGEMFVEWLRVSYKTAKFKSYLAYDLLRNFSHQFLYFPVKFG